MASQKYQYYDMERLSKLVSITQLIKKNVLSITSHYEILLASFDKALASRILMLIDYNISRSLMFCVIWFSLFLLLLF